MLSDSAISQTLSPLKLSSDNSPDTPPQEDKKLKKKVPLAGLKSLDSFSQSAGGGLTFRSKDKEKKEQEKKEQEKRDQESMKKGVMRDDKGRRQAVTKFDLVGLKSGSNDGIGGGERGERGS
eukprot:CAMPEP_0201532248 /NCGR_PEP_ID=MMETSP0161_2-20130828/49878_1 /ASSEMBLY_ACC=CAM_ASM_000251 /TAXON_ID=180227 /ORGANISM="Neoparamoeba aestuarina, Strain SoJaBio B1-5/56/2" /LENGTH=121 /DNA_ID=CAMNT_0047935561 /DNA_START=342 /DNA_END=703 /DNA_ORIENTATION=+